MSSHVVERVDATNECAQTVLTLSVSYFSHTTLLPYVKLKTIFGVLHISRNWRSKGLRGIRSLRNSVSIENVLTHS